MRGATSVIVQTHQILRLPRKMYLMIDPRHTWNAIYNARSNKCHRPNSPNTAPATKNESHHWSLSHMRRYLQCAEQQVSLSKLTKYCACHEKWISWLILVTHETLFTMRGVTSDIVQTHQILRLPRKMNLMIDPCHTCNAIYNARSNKCPCPNSPNTVPATKNESHDWSLSHMKRYLQCAEQQVSLSKLTKYCACHAKWLSKISPKNFSKTAETSFPMRGRSEQDPSSIRAGSEQDPRMIREWNRDSATRLATEVTFHAHREHFVLKNTTFRAPAIIPNFTECCACHSWSILVKHETLFTMRGATSVIVQTHQILRLARKMNLMIDPCHTCDAIYNARSNKCHCPNSPNTAPATKNESHDWSLSHMKRYLQCAEQQVSLSKLTKYCACHAKWLSWLDWAMTWLSYYLTELLLDWAITWHELSLDWAMTWLSYYDWAITWHELWLDWNMTWLSYYLTELLLDWAITWLSYYLTELLLDLSYDLTELWLDWAITWLSYYLTWAMTITWHELWLDWATTWLRYDLTELLLDWAMTWLSYGWLWLDWAMTWLSYDLTELLLDWAMTWHELWLDWAMTWLSYDLTELLLDWAITWLSYDLTWAMTWLSYDLTELLLDWAITWLSYCLTWAMTWLSYDLTELLLDWAITWHELWLLLDMSYDLTELRLDWAMTWLSYYLTELWLDWAMAGYDLTELWLDWAMTWLSYDLTELLLDWAMTWLSYDLTELWLRSHSYIRSFSTKLPLTIHRDPTDSPLGNLFSQLNFSLPEQKTVTSPMPLFSTSADCAGELPDNFLITLKDLQMVWRRDFSKQVV